MKSGLRSLTTLLVILGVGDLAMVLPMLAAYHRTAGTPPMPAIVLGAVLGVATLGSVVGVRQGRRWAFVTSIICRALDILSSVLGTFSGPGVLFHVVGVACIALSVPAVVLLVRLDPRRELRRAASGA
jgi:hypothetical protein